MAAVWKGSLSFGLVNVQVALHPGEHPDALNLNWIDKRDMSPVGYRKVNKRTGEPVGKDEIVKGYEISDGEYVLLTDEDLKRASPGRSQRIDISAFVERSAIEAVYFDKPYYLEPMGGSDKAYALLREALKRSGKVGIATVVLHAKEHLAALVPHKEALVLNLLRYQQELRDPGHLKLPARDPRKLKISEGELKMAERLIDDLSALWDPRQYKDRYREELLAFIRKKAEKGKVEPLALPAETKTPTPPADIMQLLKRSLAHGETRHRGAHASRTLH